MDNIFIEWLWRGVKYEEVYLKSYALLPEARAELSAYFDDYNNKRPHQSLGYRTSTFRTAERDAHVKPGLFFLKRPLVVLTNGASIIC